MIRLEKHDEVVEAIHSVIAPWVSAPWVSGHDIAAAALDALLEAVVRLEVGEVSDVVSGPKSYVALFLRMEASDDN
jgi:hypothetical protein